jgi:hypothetical protein
LRNFRGCRFVILRLQNASSEVAEVRGLSEVAALLEGQGTELSAASARRSLHLDPQGRASLELLLRYHQLRSALCGAAAAEGRTALDGAHPVLPLHQENGNMKYMLSLILLF